MHMNTADKQIAEILAKYGEDFAPNIWRVQGTAVIYHKALERIAAKASIRFEAPTMIRAERDEAVILVKGYRLDGARAPDGGPRYEWSIGEALTTDGTRPGNYRVSGKQSAYVYAMAEKRAKDRVILKLINLSGLVYSEAEADEFKDARPVSTAGPGEAAGAGVHPSSQDAPNQQPAAVSSSLAKLKEALDQCVSLQTFEMRRKSQAFQNEVGHLTTPERDELLAHIRARRAALRELEGGGNASPPAVRAIIDGALAVDDGDLGPLARQARDRIRDEYPFREYMGCGVDFAKTRSKVLDICGVERLREIDGNAEATEAWNDLEAGYQKVMSNEQARAA
jgi:hypothetical protein